MLKSLLLDLGVKNIKLFSIVCRFTALGKKFYILIYCFVRANFTA